MAVTLTVDCADADRKVISDRLNRGSNRGSANRHISATEAGRLLTFNRRSRFDLHLRNPRLASNWLSRNPENSLGSLRHAARVFASVGAAHVMTVHGTGDLQHVVAAPFAHRRPRSRTFVGVHFQSLHTRSRCKYCVNAHSKRDSPPALEYRAIR